MNEVVFQILKILMEMQDYGCVLGFYSKKPKEEKI